MFNFLFNALHRHTKYVVLAHRPALGSIPADTVRIEYVRGRKAAQAKARRYNVLSRYRHSVERAPKRVRAAR
jgi:hypothetical protein